MAGLALLAILVTLVWGTIFLRQFGLLGGAVAVLVIGSCFGHPFLHVNVGPLPLTADRVCLGVLVLAYLVYRLRNQLERRPLDTTDITLLLFLGFLTFSTLTHDWRAEGMRALASLLFLHLLPLALYWVVREAPLSPRALTGVLAALAAFGLYLAVMAVLEQQHLWAWVYPRYIVLSADAEFLGRGRGPFLNPVANGMYLCAGLFSLLMFWPRVARRGKVLLLVLAAVYLAGVYCTLTRVVWLAAMAGLLLILVSVLPRRWGLSGAVLAVALGSCFAVARWDDLNAFKRDQNVSVADMSQSARLRPVLAYIAWQMFQDRPLTGCGYRQYDRVADYYLTDRATELPLERARPFVQHNVFLAWLTEIGLVGLALFLIWLAALAVAAWQLWHTRSADLASRQVGLLMLLMVMAYLIMALFHDLALIPMLHMLLLFLAGLTRAARGGVACQSLPAPEERSVSSTPVPAPAALG